MVPSPDWPDAEANGNNIPFESAMYQPKSILIAFCHLYFQKYTISADYYAQIVFKTPKNNF